MINEKETTKLSKFLSLVLRHQPQTIGIVLDESGWTNIDVLIEQSIKNGVHFDRALLTHIVETNTKKRFAFSEDNLNIRANQGHSVEVELGYAPQKPPTVLYHGTAQQFVASIKQNGLEKQKRHHVHLSQDLDTAISVGKRHGTPYVFEILAEQMYLAEYPFFVSTNGVWLTDNVPPQFLKEIKH